MRRISPDWGLNGQLWKGRSSEKQSSEPKQSFRMWVGPRDRRLIEASGGTGGVAVPHRWIPVMAWRCGIDVAKHKKITMFNSAKVSMINGQVGPHESCPAHHIIASPAR